MSTPYPRPPTALPHARIWLVAGLVVGMAVTVGACEEARDRQIGAGVHPVGWAIPESPAFHGARLDEAGLREADDEQALSKLLQGCRTCHGEDYQGGAVGVSCASSGCHEAEGGPEACGTCHGGNPDDPTDPRPDTGAHAAHGRFCEECHVVPEHLNDELHVGDLEPGPDLRFAGLAVAGGASPTWHAGEQQCSGTYCHVSDAPTWDGDERECTGCHAAPPDTHELFRARATEDDCVDCHADPEGETHVDGVVDLELPDGPAVCGACHGDEETGAPPPALSGAVEADQPGVGAHARHLDPDLPDRVAGVVACASCHVVPTEDDVLADGHVDAEAPADVTLPEGATYDPAERTCVVWCHGNRDPGPEFTDDSGDARACDACHDAPPANHARFERVATGDDSCATCHPAPPAATHVNGTVDLALPDTCNTCHGTGDDGGPPLSLAGSNDPFDARVGAHARHLDPALPDRIGPVVPCTSCHVVPVDTLDPGHLDEEAPADVELPDGTYDAALRTCTTSCHWNRDPGPRWNDASGNARECGACHEMPPAVSRDGDPHPAAGPDLADCVVCHTFAPETHVDGEVTF